MKVIHKTYINNSRFMEFIDEIATQLTELNFHENTWEIREWDSENEDHFVNEFTDEAQDFYNDRYDEVETMVNNMMGVYSDNDEKK